MKDLLLSQKNYKIAFVVFIFTNTLALGYFNITINPLSYLFLFWGIAIICYNFIKKEIDFHDHKFVLILIYGFLLLFATVINQYSNQKSFILALMQLIIFTLIYNNPRNFTINDIKNELKIIVPLVNILTALASGISILMYLCDFSSSRYGWPIGMVNDRLFGIYFNCNPAAFLAAITILLALIAIKNKNKYSRLYMINIIIEVIYIILTKCRSAMIIIAIIITALYYAYFIKNKNFSKIKRYGLSIIICIGIFLGTIVTTNITSSIVNKQQENSRFQIEEVFTSIDLLLKGDVQPALKLIDQVSSGRIELLKTSYQVWQTSPIIGIGAGNFQTIGTHETSDTVVKQIQVVHSHNIFVETLVTTGIIGATIFLIFLFKTIKSLLKLFSNKSFNTYLMILLFTLIVVSEFIGSLFDYGVFYTYSLSATLFWLFLGYLNQIEKDDG